MPNFGLSDIPAMQAPQYTMPSPAIDNMTQVPAMSATTYLPTLAAATPNWHDRALAGLAALAGQGQAPTTPGAAQGAYKLGGALRNLGMGQQDDAGAAPMQMPMAGGGGGGVGPHIPQGMTPAQLMQLYQRNMAAPGASGSVPGLLGA